MDAQGRVDTRGKSGPGVAGPYERPRRRPPDTRSGTITPGSICTARADAIPGFCGSSPGGVRRLSGVSMTAQAALEPMQAFAELGLIHLGENNMSQVLGRISELAKRTIPGADEVSVSLVHAGQASTAAFTGELALHLDETQYELGGGPCLAAAAGGETMHVTDMAAEDRWPEYAPEAVSRGARSSVSVGIPVQQAVTGALNIYSTRAEAFDDEAVDLARAFASYAAVALANAHLYASTAALAGQMQDAMATRAVIEQAKGILVSQRGCTPEDAFDILVRASKNANRKLREIAESLVEKSQRG